jgi:hypothetical protein
VGSEREGSGWRKGRDSKSRSELIYFSSKVVVFFDESVLFDLSFKDKLESFVDNNRLRRTFNVDH